MTKGIQGTGLYSKERDLANTLRAHRQYLANAPLGPRQKKALEKEIADLESDLKKLRKEIRVSKSA